MARKTEFSFALLLSIGMIVGGICWLLYVKSFAATAERAEGKVTRNREGSDHKNRTTYTPEFEFKDKSGRTHIVVSDTSSRPADFSPGETVTVLYDPKQPQGARIDSVRQLYLWPLGMTIAGGILSLLFLGVRASLRKAATPCPPSTAAEKRP